jgi:hypothetical protein
LRLRKQSREGDPGGDVGLLADLFYLLEAAGLDAQLVNARNVKAAPGRPKTGKPDAVWQAKCREAIPAPPVP